LSRHEVAIPNQVGTISEFSSAIPNEVYTGLCHHLPELSKYDVPAIADLIVLRSAIGDIAV